MKIPVAYTTGFLTKDGQKRFIIDQNCQLNLTTMEWYNKDDLGKCAGYVGWEGGWIN